MSEEINDVDLRRRLLFRPCKTKDELHNWIIAYLGLDMPDSIVDEDSNSNPMDMLWEVYSKANKNDDPDFHRVLYFACRDGFKTLGAAVLEVLMILHLGRDVAHMAAIEQQAQEAQTYVKTFFRKPYLRDFVEGDNLRETKIVRFYNSRTDHSLTRKEYERLTKEEQGQHEEMFRVLTEYEDREQYIKVILCTMRSANSEHVPFFCIDEVDVVANPTAYEEAKNIPAARDGKLSITMLTSTRKFAFGLVQKEIDEKEKTGERRWRWMDEGLNSFVQFLAEQEWEDSYPSRTIRPDRKKQMHAYLKRTDIRPIMSAADNLIDGGHNAYGKPTLALTILRESVLGREQFDFAFKEYANRWKFKRPTPFDFFRTIEESSGRDLDWFWRGWFYSTDHVDVSIERVRRFRLDTRNPEVEKQHKREDRDLATPSLAEQRNRDIPKRVDQSDELNDFYTNFDDLAVLPAERDSYRSLLEDLTLREKELLQTKGNFYVVDFKNLGGVVMPLVLEIKYTDDTNRTVRMPAEIWRLNGEQISKLIFTQKKIASITVDPNDEMADADRHNNRFPRLPIEESFQLQKTKKSKNPIQQLKKQQQTNEKKEKE